MNVTATDSHHSQALHVRGTVWRDRVTTAFRALLGCIKVRRRERELQICETLSLGDKRTLLVVRYGAHRFLIGATNQSISLLDRLESGLGAKRDHGSEPSRQLVDGEMDVV